MSKKTIYFYFYITIICFVFISNCFAGSDLPYKEGELLVQFSQKADSSQRTTAERDNILAAVQGATVKKTSKFVPALTLVKLPANQTVENALEIFSKTDGILHVQPNYILHATSTYPNEIYSPGRFNEQWGMHNTGQNGGIVDADIINWGQPPIITGYIRSYYLHLLITPLHQPVIKTLFTFASPYLRRIFLLFFSCCTTYSLLCPKLRLARTGGRTRMGT